MADVLEVIWHGLRDSFVMAWEVWWALVLGFAISGIVQAWVPRARIVRAMSGSGPNAVALAAGPGAVARTVDLGVGVVCRRAQLPRRLADALQGGDRRICARRVHRPARQWLLRVAVRSKRSGAAADDRERDPRADHRGPLLRVLGRQCA